MCKRGCAEHVQSLGILYILSLANYCLTDDWSIQSDWSHDSLSDIGPRKWNSSWPECSGDLQSPVDIDTSQIWYSSSLTALDMAGYESIPPGAFWELTNVGYSVHLVLGGDYKIKDGGLPGIYKAVHVVFHWGPTEHTGSEHTINGKAYAMEMQIIHFNIEYGSYDAAMTHTDGIAVLSYLVQVSKQGNPAFSQITNKLRNISEQGDHIAIRPIPLFSLFPVNMNDYYRYSGSLTIPPCLEVVQWTVFAEAAFISEEQLAAFQAFKISAKNNPRRHYGLDGVKVPDKHYRQPRGNCRPLQPLGGRTMYSSNPNDANILTSPVGSTLSIILAAFLGCMLMLFLITKPIGPEDSYEVINQHED